MDIFSYSLLFNYLMSEGAELFSEGLEIVALKSGGSLSLGTVLLFPDLVGSFLSLRFQLFNNILVLPTGVSAQITQQAEISEVLESDDLKGRGDDLSLSGVIRGGDTFEDLELTKGGGTSGSFMGKHASDGSPEDSGGGSVMDDTSSGVVDHLLSHEFRELDLVSEEGARDVDSFGSDDDDSLSAEEFLGDDGSESSEQMALGVDNDFLFKH